MGPLLEIRCIPFQYEMVVKDARLEMDSSPAQQKVTRQAGGFKMNHTPARIKIDSSLARQSLGHKGVLQITQENGDKGVAAANDAIGQIASEGNQMMNARKGEDAIGNISIQRTQSVLQTMLGFLPSTTAQVSFDPHELQMKYDMDKLTFDWRSNNRPDMRFTPASIDMKIKNYAKVEIQYLGGPIYAPPSSDPNYTQPMGMDLRG